MRAELVEDAGRLEQVAREWDELAVARARPYASPHWLIPWWEAAAPAGSRLRTVLVHDGPRLVGVAPFFLGRDLWGARVAATLGRGASTGVEPVAVEGAEAEVAALAARALSASRPAPQLVLLDVIPAASRWPGLLAEGWPGTALPAESDPAPIVARPAGGYEEWLAGRSSHFRKRMRRAARELDELGSSFRPAGPDTLDADLSAFACLHRARWEKRGGTAVLTPGVERMLSAAGRRLGPERFRLWLLELEGRPVCAEIVMAAGGRASFWLGGFDPAHARLQPSIQTMLRAIEQAFELGDETIDLGLGGQEFKYRLADGDEVLGSFAIVRRGPAGLPARARLSAARLRRAAAASPLGGPVRALRRRLSGRR
ncbi:MAG TPA: GNAT family N-acetyltransferase [Gaiellaceae bacterium]|nr:GNAT family N-acetyltransferase [Gaiellaceae bacterium]